MYMDPIVNEAEVIDQQEVAKVVTEVKPQPGEKTDSALLLESLHKERDKRRQLEAELAAARQNAPHEEVAFSDEGRNILKVVDSVKTELETTRKELAMRDVFAVNPVLKDKREEFDAFLSENPGMRLETAAKAFIVENDLVEKPVQRKGLEPVSGGGRTPVKTGLSPDEADNLRVTNYREYAKRIRNGTLNTN